MNYQGNYVNHKKSETFTKLKAARNLVVSCFFILRNSNSFLEFFNDQDDIHKVNGLLYKAKTRFETLKVVFEAAPESLIHDMEYALVKSFQEYYESVYAVINQQNWDFREFEDINNKYIEEYFGDIKFDDFETFGPISKNSARFYQNLANETNGANAYYESLLIAKEVLNSINLTSPSHKKVVREITFPPEFTQAGIGLLSYFSSIIEKKYPDMDVSISIQQIGNTVTLSITHPDGRQEEIVHTLNNYGLVLSGKLSPEDILEDKIQVLALKHKLELAKMEVSQAKDIMELERHGSNKRIETLESEVDTLKSIVGMSMQSNETTQQKLLDLFAAHIETSSENVSLSAIRELGLAISERNSPKAELILDDMNTKDPKLFSRLNKFIAEGAISGVIGNSAYSWLLTIIASLPK